MSDRRLRELERRWIESDSSEDRARYAKARKHAGLPKLPRLVIRHYIKPDDHGVCGPDGKIDRVFGASDGQYYPSYAGHQNAITSSCSVELWPRNLYAKARNWSQTMKKDIYYTEDSEEVTCKRCLKSINKLPEGVRRRMHYAPGSKVAPRVDDCNERVATPVCGRNDSEKFQETFSHTMLRVNCPACMRIMEQGRRRSRLPRQEHSTKPPIVVNAVGI